MISSATARSRRFLPLALVAALAGSFAFVAPAGAAGNAVKPFSVNLYRDGDFVSQTNTVQCVGASMQMMINMMAKDDRSAKWQLELQVLARRYSPRNYNGTEANGQVRERRGASVRGWAFGLAKLGYGPYRVSSGATIEQAALMAAKAIVRTGRPVGLLVWRGRHAWVMSGFESIGNPLTDPDAKVTHVWILDPLYPRTSSTWGPSPRPNTKMTLSQLATDFLPRRSSQISSGTAGRYTFVMPLPDARTRTLHGNNLD